MTRYKRRKISGIVKCFAAVVLPIAAAVSVSGASRLKSVLSNTQIMQTRGTPPTSSTVCKDEFDEIFGDCASDTSDIPTAFLSQGYGVTAETADTSALLKLPAPRAFWTMQSILNRLRR